jgi:hypothetical protein
LTTRIIFVEYRRFYSSYFCSFPTLCYFIPLRSKYSPQHLIRKHPQPTFLLQCQRPSFTPILSVVRVLIYTVVIVCVLTLRNDSPVHVTASFQGPDLFALYFIALMTQCPRKWSDVYDRDVTPVNLLAVYSLWRLACTARLVIRCPTLLEDI